MLRNQSTSGAVNRGARKATAQVEVTQEMIARRAYELFEERGRLHGFDDRDWLTAESELLSVANRVKRVARRTTTASKSARRAK